jgi:uncharacterized protein (DUF1015 family)
LFRIFFEEGFFNILDYARVVVNDLMADKLRKAEEEVDVA